MQLLSSYLPFFVCLGWDIVERLFYHVTGYTAKTEPEQPVLDLVRSRTPPDEAGQDQFLQQQSPLLLGDLLVTPQDGQVVGLVNRGP